MQIRSMPLPSGPADATDPAWSDVQALAALGNDIMFELEGDHDLARSPEQIHAAYADQRYEERLAWLAVEDDQLVGFASLRMPRAETTGAAHCSSRCAPIGDGRGSRPPCSTHSPNAP